MHGVPADLDLSYLIGSSIERVDLGPYILHLHFAEERGTVISVEGDWELVDSAGHRLDGQQEPAERDCYRLHKLLMRDVTAFELSAPRWFSLTFDGGYTLRVFDNSDRYESFSIKPHGIFV